MVFAAYLTYDEIIQFIFLRKQGMIDVFDIFQLILIGLTYIQYILVDVKENQLPLKGKPYYNEIDDIKMNKWTVYNILMNSSLVLLSIVHIMNLMRNFKSFGILVQLVFECVLQVIPFLIFYLSFLSVFSLVYQMVGIEMDE